MRLPALPLLALLAACSAIASLRTVSATGDAVVFEYANDRAAQAMREAALYCANLGKNASLRDVTPEQGDRSIAAFDCR